MLKSCKYCGRIHDSQYDCGRKPQPQKRITYIDRFRGSRMWRGKREQIRRRDKNLCQVCIRNLYGTDRQYNYENLSVHHAIPIETDYDKRLDDDNLLTVCGMHHEMAESGEIPYISIHSTTRVETSWTLHPWPRPRWNWAMTGIMTRS